MSTRIHIRPIHIIPFLVVALLVIISTSVSAQNTKGDKPAASPRPFLRFPKFKSKKKGGDRPNTQDLTGRRRISTRSPASRVVLAEQSPYIKRKPSKEKVHVPRGGAKLRIRSSTAEASRNNVYPNHGEFVNNPSRRPRDNQRAYSNRKALSKAASLSSKRQPPGRKKVISARTASRSFVTRGRKNVYWGKFRKGEKAVTTDISGQPLRAKNFHTPGLGVIPSHDVYKRKNKKPGDRPYRGTFTSGYVTTPKVTKAWRGDVSGHAIRSRPPKVSQTAGRMFEPRKLSSSRRKDRAARPMRSIWLVKHTRSGKISNSAIQGKAPGLGAIAIDRSLGKFGGGKKPKVYGTARVKSFNNKGQAIPNKAPGIGARFIDFYQGFLKSRKPIKGGGSISGRQRNNGGLPVNVKGPGIGGRFVDIYSGTFKARRPIKGGGSISGRQRNNGGQPVNVKGPGIGGRFVDIYSGTFKARRPIKGGGSISGRQRNNGGQPVNVKGPGIGGRFVDIYSGTFKARRPIKGGGSISGRQRNNGGQPILVKAPAGIQSKYVDIYQGFQKGRKIFNTDGSDYAGNIKIWRQPKGGGSISGKLWNNSNHPIIGKAPAGIQAKYVDIYQGYYRGHKPLKGGGSVSGKLWNNKEHPIEHKSVPVQGMKIGGYSGDIKAKRPEKGGGSVSGKLWNNKEHPIAGKSVSPAALKVSVYSGDHKVKGSEKYIRNPNSKEEALKKIKPGKSTYLVNNLVIKTKAQENEHNKRSAKAALNGVSAGKNSLKAIEYSSRIKVLWTKTFEPNKPLGGRIPMQKYVHAPNSKKGALMVLGPGRAYARIKDLQVNVKMTKPHGNNLHPDSKFANSYRDNVKHERTFLMSLKLKWAKLFKKNDTQPKAVKERTRRPRYDPKERDLWKDLYD